MPHDQYQTVQDVADRLKVSEATVRHWIKDKALRAIDVGKGWRISDSDFEDFLQRHETRPRRAECAGSTLTPQLQPPAYPDAKER